MRIHITGASGSGVSTLGRALSQALDMPVFDADDYYWLPTTPPFTTKRDAAERVAWLRADLLATDRSILAGSIVGWDPAIEDSFDLIVFLTLDATLRVTRLRARELQEHGIIDDAFLAWAAAYDDAPITGRSLAKHRHWLAARTCPVLELHGDQSVESRTAAVLQAVAGVRKS